MHIYSFTYIYIIINFWFLRKHHNIPGKRQKPPECLYETAPGLGSLDIRSACCLICVRYSLIFSYIHFVLPASWCKEFFYDKLSHCTCPCNGIA